MKKPKKAVRNRVMTLRMSTADLKMLQSLARANDRSCSDLVRLLIRAGYENMTGRLEREIEEKKASLVRRGLG